MSGGIRQSAGLIKHRLEKYLQQIKMPDLQADPVPQCQLIEHQRDQLQQAINQLSHLEDQWIALFSQLDVQETDREMQLMKLAQEPEGFLGRLEQAREQIIVLNSYLTQLKTLMPPVTPQRSASATSPTAAHGVLRLPKIELRTFNGNSARWPVFWDWFVNTIDSQPLTDTEKLTYFTSSMQGPAKQLVEAYQLRNAPYKDVVERVKARYASKEVIIQKLYDELEGLQRFQEGRYLRKFIEEVERIVELLSNQGEDINNKLIQRQIERKLPKWILMDLEKTKLQQQTWNINNLREFLANLALAQEAVNRAIEPHETPKGPKDTPRGSLHTDHIPQISSAFPAVTKPSRTTRCAFCEQNHWSSDCTVYKSTAERRQRCQEQRKCYRCLREGHFTTACQAVKPCYFCKQQHHQAMCPTRQRQQQPKFGVKNFYNQNSHNTQNSRNSHNTHDVQHFTKASRQHNNVTLHVNTEVQDTVQQIQEPGHSVEDANSVTAASATQNEGNTILLWCAEVSVYNPITSKRAKVLVFFDSGSQRSFITNRLADALQLDRSRKERLNIAGFGSLKLANYDTSRTQVALECANKELQYLTVNTVPQITAEPLQYINLKDINLEFDAEWTKITTTRWGSPQILIGADQIMNFLQMPSKENNTGLHMLRTKLGTILTGTGPIVQEKHYKKTKSRHQTYFAGITNVSNTPETIENFWRLETLGIRDSEDEEDDQIAQRIFDTTVTRNSEGRIVVSWPWKPHPEKPLSNNYGLCLGRLRSLWNRLRHNEEFLHEYDSIFAEQREKGIIEKAPKQPTNTTHFLPHQAVLRQDHATTKLRIVFDASAKLPGFASLNDHMLRGPVILPDLGGILFRWRSHEITIIADLEKAFLQLEIHPTDRDVTRFLWLKDVSRPPQADNLEVYRYTRVLFGIKPSPFLLASAIRFLLTHINTDLAKAIARDVYVDNVFISATDTKDAQHKYVAAKSYFESAKMNLREFLSNDTKLMKELKQPDRKQQTTTKVLGVLWDSIQDVIIMRIPEINTVTQTKRAILHMTAANFDPMGFLAPSILLLKQFLQELWKKQYHWDNPLQTEEKRLWEHIVKNWNATEYIIPRRLPSPPWHLHIFSDASSYAYAAVAYITSQGPNEHDRKSCFLFAKTRLAPIKGTTIPRAELLGVLIATRMAKYIREHLLVPDLPTTIWSDSQAVLNWIASLPPKERFIQNRLREIKTTKADFRYVPSTENPADIASRGCSPGMLKSATHWWVGPEWLTRKKEAWPQWHVTMKIPKSKHEDNIKEEESSEQNIANTQIITISLLTESFINVQRFSKWRSLRNTVARILFFIHRLRKTNATSTYQGLSEEATKILVKQTQRNLSQQDIKKWHLEKGTDDIWRFSGRMNALQQSSAQLIFLPRHSYITKLLIEEAHQQTMHAGIPLTLTKFRERFWIEKGKRTVGKILSLCPSCKRWQSKPFALPDMTAYPTERVNRSLPFENVGLDYMGPIVLQNLKKERIKRWIAIFTCFTTRAVHLEVVNDLSAESCMHIFRRFVARRGYPKLIYSDNGTQMRLLAQTIELQCQRHSSFDMIRWKFITPQAPWQGGIYERLIGLIKQSLKRAINRRLVKEQEFVTLCTEIEAIINSRPITPVEDDSTPVLRPIDFLMPFARLSSTAALEDSDKHRDPDFENPRMSSQEKLVHLWKDSNRHLQNFWKVWYTHYLQALRDRAEWAHKQPKAVVRRRPKVGEIVIVQQDTPRALWPLAKITEMPNKSPVRSAKITLANGSQLERPINHLYPLEVNTTEEQEQKPLSRQKQHDTNEQEDIIQHPLDRNLQQEANDDQAERQKEDTRQTQLSSWSGGSFGSERETQKSTRERRKGSGLVRNMPILLLAITLIMQIQLMQVQAIKSNRCTASRTGVLLQLPAEERCEEIAKEKSRKFATVALFAPRRITMRAHVCVNITRTICTKAFLVWELKVTQDRTEITGVQASVCQQMRDKGEVYSHMKRLKLKQESDLRWKTKEPVHYAYGWFGTRCYSVSNFLLEELEMRTFDATHVILDLGQSKKCLIKKGECHGPRGTAVWEPQEAKQCSFEKKGIYMAILNEGHVMIPTLQASFVFTRTSPVVDHCNISQPIAMENGFIIQPLAIHTKDRAKRSLKKSEEMDESNPKFQFLYDKLKEEISKAESRAKEKRCHLRNNIKILMKWLAKRDATTAAELLLEREDIVADYIQGKLVVYPCEGSSEIKMEDNRTKMGIEDIVFKAAALTHWEADLLSDTLNEVSRSHERYVPSGERKQSIFDTVRDESEEAMENLRKDLGKAASEVITELEEVVSRWKKRILLTMCFGIAVVLVFLWWRCQCFPSRCRETNKEETDKVNGKEIKTKEEKKKKDDVLEIPLVEYLPTNRNC